MLHLPHVYEECSLETSPGQNNVWFRMRFDLMCVVFKHVSFIWATKGFCVLKFIVLSKKILL